MLDWKSAEKSVSTLLGRSSNRSELGDRDRIVIITRRQRKRQVTTSLLPSSSFVILNVTAAVVESMRATHSPPPPTPHFPRSYTSATSCISQSPHSFSPFSLFPRNETSFSRDLTSSHIIIFHPSVCTIVRVAVCNF